MADKVLASLVRNPGLEVPELLTPRLRMRGHGASDYGAVARIWAEPAVVRHISGRPSTDAESWSRLLRYIGHWRALGYGYWALEDRASGVYLGEVGFADFHRDIQPSLHGIPEAGWILAPEAQGRGLATEALGAALRWADENFTNAVTACIVDPEHHASIQVARKCGYTEKARTTFLGMPTLMMERKNAFRSAD